MNDESNAYYVDSIDQMTRGHQFLLVTFGVKPTIGWHIDQFGHTSSQDELLSLMNFDGFLFGRIDYQDRQQRRKEKNLEFIWSPSPTTLGSSVEIFSGVLYDGYGPVDDQLCFD